MTADQIQRAWTGCRARHPLLAARIEGQSFVVDEGQAYDEVGQVEDAKAFAEELWRKTPFTELDDNRLSRLYVELTTTGFEWVLVMPHVLNDAIATFTVTRTMLELLAHKSSPLDDLAVRLDRLLSCEAQFHGRLERTPRTLWRMAIAAVTLRARQQRLACGTAFPRRRQSSDTRLRSESVSHHLSEQDSAAVRELCRQHGISYADLHTSIARIAYARMMHRLRDTMDEEEWRLRRILPVTLGAPLNVRSLCGGTREVFCCIAFRDEVMPAMPTGGGLPSFDELVSIERLIHIAKTLAQRRKRRFSHPLTPEMLLLRSLGICQIPRGKKRLEMPEVSEDRQQTALIGGSIGDMDSLCPRQVGDIVFEEHSSYPRCRKGEWYLGTRGFGGRIRLFLTYDGSTYDDQLAQQYIDEVHDALRHFVLGRRGSSAS